MSFHKKRELVQLSFWPIEIRNNIVVKKTIELVLFFHKNIKKLVFLWPNMGQKRHQNVNKIVNKITNRPTSKFMNILHFCECVG